MVFMQTDLVHHPPTPRYDPKFANKRMQDAVRAAVLSGRDFSFLLGAEEIRQRNVDMRPERQAAGWGYGVGRYNGD